MKPARPVYFRGRRGNAMAEFALAVGVFVPTLLGVFQFGYAFYVYNQLVGAVREAARYASIRVYDSSTETPSDSYLAAVRNAAVYGNTDGSGQPIVSGLATNKIAVAVSMIDGVPDMVTVSVSDYTMNTIVNSFHLTNKPAASFHFEGRFHP